ncbi:MAG: L,D-transpeptidase family protein [Anaerolineae bacterium]|nr:L,D-transpeptidase family protein [Anaerolineae bacterium]
MEGINRRQFLKLGGAVMAGMLLPKVSVTAATGFTTTRPAHLPASQGRIATWWRQAIRAEPDPNGEWVAWKTRDEIIPLYAAVEGVPPWPTNPIWYQTEGGYIHSGYVQPVENIPNGEVVQEVAAPGFWGQVCVPIAEARWNPTSNYTVYKLYYGTVYRIVASVLDREGRWWYQLQEGVTWGPGPYVPARTIRRIPPEALSPISPGHPDKWIRISIEEQTVTCMEGETPVFSTPTASGLYGTGTPLGEFNILYKRHAQRMIGEDYDLPGIAFPVYFTWSGVAIHGTYWHNDYGRRHSHGCLNVPNDAAQWIFRWVEPYTPYELYTQRVPPGAGTRVVVV